MAKVVINPGELIDKARIGLTQAYAPYSKFPVGAAVMDDRGRIFTGANVENASYGLTMCAERVAIFSAIAAGAHRIAAVAVTAKNVKPVAPCGACRQVMAEFCEPDAPVFSDAGANKKVTWTVGGLLPEAFTSKHLTQRQTSSPKNRRSTVTLV